LAARPTSRRKLPPPPCPCRPLRRGGHVAFAAAARCGEFCPISCVCQAFPSRLPTTPIVDGGEWARHWAMIARTVSAVASAKKAPGNAMLWKTRARTWGSEGSCEEDGKSDRRSGSEVTQTQQSEQGPGRSGTFEDLKWRQPVCLAAISLSGCGGSGEADGRPPHRPARPRPQPPDRPRRARRRAMAVAHTATCSATREPNSCW
jgi:hypothetical protein